jgi:hypothetical protein
VAREAVPQADLRLTLLQRALETINRQLDFHCR